MNETTSPVVPQLDIRDSFDLRELNMQRFARAGITSYGLCPGVNALIGGQISLIHSQGLHAADVFIREHIGVKGNYTKTVKTVFSPKSVFMTRMGMYAYLDEAFRGAQEYMGKDGVPFDAGREEFVVNNATIEGYQPSKIDNGAEINPVSYTHLTLPTT